MNTLAFCSTRPFISINSSSSMGKSRSGSARYSATASSSMLCSLLNVRFRGVEMNILKGGWITQVNATG